MVLAPDLDHGVVDEDVEELGRTIFTARNTPVLTSVV
jgi:hypothetical protein